MEVSATNNQINSALQLASEKSGEATAKPLNAFGIGQANKPEIELSPQGKILQQAELAQSVRQKSVDQPKQQESAEQQDSNNNYIRVSSSIGNAQRNNLSGDQATELYRSIEKLL